MGVSVFSAMCKCLYWIYSCRPWLSEALVKVIQLKMF